MSSKNDIIQQIQQNQITKHLIHYKYYVMKYEPDFVEICNEFGQLRINSSK